MKYYVKEESMQFARDFAMALVKLRRAWDQDSGVTLEPDDVRGIIAGFKSLQDMTQKR